MVDQFPANFDTNMQRGIRTNQLGNDTRWRRHGSTEKRAATRSEQPACDTRTGTPLGGARARVSGVRTSDLEGDGAAVGAAVVRRHALVLAGVHRLRADDHQLPPLVDLQERQVSQLDTHSRLSSHFQVYTSTSKSNWPAAILLFYPWQNSLWQPPARCI